MKKITLRIYRFMRNRISRFNENSFQRILKLYPVFFAKKSCVRFNERLFQLSLRGLGILNWQTDKISGEKNLIEKILPELIKSEKPVFFDVGANVGHYSGSLSAIFPNATIYLFEPHPVTFDKLSKNCLSKNWRLFNLALGSETTQLNLYDNENEDGSEHASVYKEVIDEIHHYKIKSHKINVETLDKFCEKENAGDIDFIKIDTEGHEFEVLKGAINSLKNRKIRYMQIEFNEMNVVSRVFFKDIKHILHDYKLYRLLPTGLLSLNDSIVETEIFAFQNIFAVLKTR